MSPTLWTFTTPMNMLYVTIQIGEYLKVNESIELHVNFNLTQPDQNILHVHRS